MKFADWGFTFPETPLKPNKTMSHGDSISFETDILSIISPRDCKSMKLAHKNGYTIPKLKKSFNLLGYLEKKA